MVDVTSLYISGFLICLLMAKNFGFTKIASLISLPESELESCKPAKPYLWINAKCEYSNQSSFTSL